MDFKFNFADPSEERVQDQTTGNDLEIVNDKNRSESAEFSEIRVTEIKCAKWREQQQCTKLYKCSEEISVSCYDNTIIVEKLVESKGDNSSVVKADCAHSDLIPYVYEGGLTVWECGLDLAEYIATENISFKDKCALELGCGAGIPGICAMKLQAREVHFQDYNNDVLEMYTIPNVQDLNPTSSCTCRFFAGDWSKFCEYAKNCSDTRYDFILTAETIYNPDNYRPLHDLFKCLLKPGGTVYLAAKSNYFGVGGGTQLFKDFVRKEGFFTTDVVKDIVEGIPREIMKLTWKEKT